MMTKSIQMKQPVSLKGELIIPGDKSISHRAVMFASIAEGKTDISNFLLGADCLSTIDCFRKMGVKIEQEDSVVTVYGKGLTGLTEPEDVLDVGNSGTTTRLLLGILATLPFHVVVNGDESIAKRPMNRVTKPLKQMGAKIDGRENGNYTPISIRGGETKGISFESRVASAQVKSCLLLAGLNSEGTTIVSEPFLSRDHSERMLTAFGAKVTRKGTTVTIEGKQSLKGTSITIPGDISSAAFFLVAAAITPGSNLLLKNVGMNPTRIGIIDVLQKMNANVTILNEHIENEEPIADLRIQFSTLQATEIAGELIPRLIDEIPVIALLATQAEGTTIIKNAEELKVKETNRIDTVVNELKKLGANIEPTDDGMVIHGKTMLHGGHVTSYGDHRIGMMLAVASLLTDEAIILEQEESIKVSYPTFFEDFERILHVE
ncbi:3-phosphoshikimate 1-carboxyvinyltransferase [Massilibacterium senegalense]|uniref:3-phosphoshikimate 1-carboxyvinyltransferase n=1 Tax=Massilibacterium senegalense TaxID=1632858 RepID=UPI0011CCD4E4|nr:3-phosphoshikimate 1-carboxyvinyltransferase [Massilibacterium senegalense]